MGEVRVKVTLENYGDFLLARQKVLLPENVRRVIAEALVDTGAVQCVIPQAVCEKLGLQEIGRQTAQYADGREESVPVVDGVNLIIEGRRTFEECLVLGDEILIGQTVLEKTDLFVDARGKRVVPNPAHPNQPVIKIR